MHQDKMLRRYRYEMFAAILLYAVVLVVSILIAHRLPPGGLQTTIVITPMIPFFLMIAAIVRHLRRMDEYIRLRELENIVLVAGVTAAWTFTYGFLEGVGYPRLSMFTVWGVMGVVWTAVAIVRGACLR